MRNMKPKTHNPEPNSSQEGVVVIMTLLLASVILSIVLTLSLIFIPKIRAASDIKNSAGAFYAAETAIEWCLYVNRIGSVVTPTMLNGATFVNGNINPARSFVPADCSALPIKSIGSYMGVVRALDVNL